MKRCCWISGRPVPPKRTARRAHRSGLLIAVIAILIAASPSRAADYTVEWLIRGDKAVLERIKERADLLAPEGRQTETMWELTSRIRRDVEMARKVLQANGYFAGQVSYDVDSYSRPVEIRMRIDTGPAYQIESYTVSLPDEAGIPADLEAEIDRIRNVLEGERARSDAIMDAHNRMIDILPHYGFPKGTSPSPPQLVIDHAARTAAVSATLEPGPAALFGPVTISGLNKVEQDYVESFILWKEGADYDQRKVDATHRGLYGTGLFATVEVDDSGAVGEDGALPVEIRLQEADQRSVGGALSYSTSEGIGGEIFWEHRTIFGEGERLRLRLGANQLIQAFQSEFEKPKFLRDDQQLLLDFDLKREDSDAFLEYTVGAGAALQRQFGRYWSGRAGVDLDFSDLREDDRSRQVGLISVPVGIQFDNTNDVLDPSRGFRVFARTAPFFAIEDDPFFFVRSEIGARYYQSLDNARRYIAATRVRLGSIVGQERARIPANKRFYAGGGASIRGYDFQLVGPLDEENDPTGGRSVIEVSAEMRARVSDKIGIVPFFEGGTVFETAVPDFSEPMRWAAGLGFRYHTSFGPIRVDFARAIDPRPVDDAFEFYISLGQSF